MSKKDWLPDVRKLMKIVIHQKAKIAASDWYIQKLLQEIDKIRSEKHSDKKKEKNLN